MIPYCNILHPVLAFVISLSNFNIFLFEQKLDANISHNISRIT